MPTFSTFDQHKHNLYYQDHRQEGTENYHFTVLPPLSKIVSPSLDFIIDSEEGKS